MNTVNAPVIITLMIQAIERLADPTTTDITTKAQKDDDE